MNITIGKYTLESLTFGMYLDPMILYREYLQNAVDSIDDARDRGIMELSESRILIELDRKEHAITIQDNGLGIPRKEAAHRLLAVGSSDKSIEDRRGFRGVGRLVGLSYCRELVFETSCYGESVGTEVTFDCSLLNELLVPGRFEHYDLETALRAITSVNYFRAEPSDHFFRVTLRDVSGSQVIMDLERVAEYVAQVAPLPYDSSIFSHAEEIHQAFSRHGLELTEYNVFIRQTGGEEQQLFKPYCDRFQADRARKAADQLEEVVVEEIEDGGRLQALLWYGNCHFYGTILDDRIKGLRFRKGNIQVGDRFTLNHLFKEERFNGWFQGEVFVLDSRVIPNTRRDDFERNENYQTLLQGLEGCCTAMVKKALQQRVNSERAAGKPKDVDEAAVRGLALINQVLGDIPDERVSGYFSGLNSAEKRLLGRVAGILGASGDREEAGALIKRLLTGLST